MTVVNLADGAGLVWAAPVLSRGFELTPRMVGEVMGTSMLVGGLIGALSGGLLADYCQKSGGPRKTVVATAAIAAVGAVSATFALMPSVALFGCLLIVFHAVGFVLTAMVSSTTMVVIPENLRGTVFSTQFALGALVGLGAAPLTVSGTAALLGGPAAIGLALALVCVTTSAVAVPILWIGRRYFAMT